MKKAYFYAISAIALSFSVSSHVYAQNMPDCEPGANGVHRLSGFVDRQESKDDPGEKINGLIETKPVTGNANLLRWMFSPIAGRGAFDKWMKQAHPDFQLSEYKNDSTALLEVVGNHERGRSDRHICGIACNRVTLNEFSAATSKVLVSKGPQVLISHSRCGCRMFEQPPRDFSEDAQSIRDFVDKGGYMLITGRDLDSIDKIFPGMVAPLPGVGDHDHLYDAELVKPDPVLGDNLVTDARWYVPMSYPLLKVLNADAVRVLSSSHELAKQDPETNGVLATLFPYGKGYVMCLAGTLDNTIGVVHPAARVGLDIPFQLPDAAPKIHIAMRQALAANFIEAGLTGTKIRTTR